MAEIPGLSHPSERCFISNVPWAHWIPHNTTTCSTQWCKFAFIHTNLSNDSTQLTTKGTFLSCVSLSSTYIFLNFTQMYVQWRNFHLLFLYVYSLCIFFYSICFGYKICWVLNCYYIHFYKEIPFFHLIFLNENISCCIVVHTTWLSVSRRYKRHCVS